MAKFDGKYLSGAIGNLSFRKIGKQQIVQMKPVRVNQSKSTKKIGKLFGKSSRIAKNIRFVFNMLIHSNYDGKMVNRMNAEVGAILRHCYDIETEKLNFTEDSFGRLSGFEFNSKSLFKNYFWAQVQTQISDGKMLIEIPAFEIDPQLKFPDRQTICELNIQISVFYMEDNGYCKIYPKQTLEILKNQASVPAHVFSFNVPDGCLCIAGLSLTYYEMKGNDRKEFNNKTFNPATICSARFSPGVYVPEKIMRDWRFMALNR